MRAAAIAILLTSTACGSGGEPASGPYRWCRDVNGVLVGQFMHTSSSADAGVPQGVDAGEREPEGFCLYRSAGGAEWKVDRETAKIGPVFDELWLDIGFTDSSCSGAEHVICFPQFCSSLTFQTHDGKVRAATGGGGMSLQTFSSIRPRHCGTPSCAWECQHYVLAGPVPSVPVSDAPALDTPRARFAPPLRLHR